MESAHDGKFLSARISTVIYGCLQNRHLVTCRTVLPKIGDSITVRTSHPYELPNGITEGQTVQVVGDRTAGVVVMDEVGTTFNVAIQCCDTEHEYLLNGHWVPESHPLILEHLIASIVDLETTRCRWPKGIERTNEMNLEHWRAVLRKHMR